MTLAELPERWTAEEVEGGGWIVQDTRYETAWHITDEAFAGLTLPQLEAITPAGRNVDHISRVTGYFSRTSGWNKGKQAELRDRARTGL